MRVGQLRLSERRRGELCRGGEHRRRGGGSEVPAHLAGRERCAAQIHHDGAQMVRADLQAEPGQGGGSKGDGGGRTANAAGRGGRSPIHDPGLEEQFHQA